MVRLEIDDMVTGTGEGRDGKMSGNREGIERFPRSDEKELVVSVIGKLLQ